MPLPKRECESFWIYYLTKNQVRILRENLMAYGHYHVVGREAARVYTNKENEFRGAISCANPEGDGAVDPIATIYSKGVVLVDKGRKKGMDVKSIVDNL